MLQTMHAAVIAGLLLTACPAALAQSESTENFQLRPDDEGEVTQEEQPERRTHLRAPRTEEDALPHHKTHFREVNTFFNVREANPDVHAGEWLVETTGFYQTRSGGSDDDAAVSAALNYGLTDDLFVSLELLPVLLGDGGDHGAGDLAVGVFYRILEESDSLPAVATWADMRIPSGDGSSGVDASLNFGLTRSFTDHFRVHATGMVETLNGSRGDEGGFGRTSRRGRGRETGLELPPVLEGVRRIGEVSELFGEEEEEGRRSFRWEVGVGADYLFDEYTLGVINYVNRSNEEEGLRNENILELGVVRVIAPHQVIKAAVDIGLTGSADTPNLTAKVQYGLAF